VQSITGNILKYILSAHKIHKNDVKVGTALTYSYISEAFLLELLLLPWVHRRRHVMLVPQ